MRVIGAGLAVFLTVTVILLYQVSSGGGETVAIGVVASPEPTVTAPPPPAPSPAKQPVRAVPTVTKTIVLPTATATTAPIEPTVHVAETDAGGEEPVIDETDALEADPVDDAPAIEPAVDPTTSVDDNDAYLASVDTSDAWNDAIETPNGGMIGTVLSGLANVRAFPTVDAEVIDTLHAGWPVAIYSATIGDTIDGADLWYQVGGGGYVSALLVAPFVPVEPDVSFAGHWVDVDLTRNIAVAYIDDEPVNAVTIISGKTGFETPAGEHAIFARVESETLDSSTVGIPKDDPEYYYLPDVPYTQYFATGGFAIHANYWSDPWQFGSSSSHGCINMFAEDAAWFWWFLDIGSVVNVHY